VARVVTAFLPLADGKSNQSGAIFRQLQSRGIVTTL